jgi:hypothetical protein
VRLLRSEIKDVLTLERRLVSIRTVRSKAVEGRIDDRHRNGADAEEEGKIGRRFHGGFETCGMRKCWWYPIEKYYEAQSPYTSTSARDAILVT